MQILVKLPDDIAEGMGRAPDLPRQVYEAVLLQRYLAEQISLGRLAELLELSQPEAEAFLDRNNSRLPYTREMLQQDRRNLAEILGDV